MENKRAKMFHIPGYSFSVNPAYVASTGVNRPYSGRERRHLSFVRRLIREKLLGKKPRKYYVTKKPVKKFRDAVLAIEMIDGTHWPIAMPTKDRAIKARRELNAMVAAAAIPEVVYVCRRQDAVRIY